MGDVREEARTRKKKCGEKDEDELHCWNDGGNISVKISVKNRVANPDEFSTFGRDTFPYPPKGAELVVICRSDEGSLHRPPVLAGLLMN